MVRVDSRTQELHIEDVMIYPRLGQFDPYVQQLMILILKSTQNLGVGLQQSVKEEDLVGGSSVLILGWPCRLWSLVALIGEEGDGGMRWRRGSRCPSSGCLALGVERRQMERSVW